MSLNPWPLKSVRFGNKHKHLNRRQFITLLFVAAGTMALLAIGAMWQREAFLTRGIPGELPSPIPHGGPELALNVYLDQYDDNSLAENLSNITALGVDSIKQSFYFNDNFDWEASDRLVTAVADQNLTLIPLLDGNPANNFAPPSNPNAYAAWAAEFARRYSDQITYYIIWDEPNLSSHWGGQSVNAHEYAALLSAAAAAIRTVDNDAVIVAAPLAPTVETGPQNLADHLYLQQLFEAGAADAFDIVAGKPYGFNSGPDDRTVSNDVLNFSRVILLLEVLEHNDEAHKAVWAGNWGWNSLPDDWTGAPSVWGQVDRSQQAAWIVAALKRARQEWPWMGLMFLENWQPDASDNDPRWGFAIADTETAVALQNYLQSIDTAVAYPGFHLADENDPAQTYRGGWRFSPQYGADISETSPEQLPDSVTFTFWGTDIGLRVRRADYRARLYVTVDDQPANALPHDENGAMLILTSPDPSEDFVTTVTVAQGLTPGIHTVKIVASRGWDQWALNGFSVGYISPDRWFTISIVALALLAVVAFVLAIIVGRNAQWGRFGNTLSTAYGQLNSKVQLLITAVTAAIVALTGWFTWGEQLAGVYRRLGDGGQLALTAAAASVFYVTPSFFIYAVALIVLFVLIVLRPAWGLALITFCFPFYVASILKPIFIYRFSPLEIFTLVTFAAFLLTRVLQLGRTQQQKSNKWRSADTAVLALVLLATFSLFFTERLDVATNEWRLLIIEPAIFYLMLRVLNPEQSEMWILLDAFVLGGVVVALYGLGQYITGQNLITAEGGLLRLRSFYGSPNNVALYLGRIIPLLAAMALLGGLANGRRRWAYALALVPTGLAVLLTFSKGGIFLGVPAGLLVVFWFWLRRNGRSPWPWVFALGIVGLIGLLIIQSVPQLSERFSLTGATGIFRLNLWRASLEMIRQHPLLGVGLDNFLYAYRGRYIFDAAWQEPNLNHPHNIILDFSTRLGLLGLLVGIWLVWELFRTLRKVHQHVTPVWLPVVVGLSGALAAMLAHGLVDHSFFLVDLAFVFYLMLGTAVWLDNLPIAPKISEQS